SLDTGALAVNGTGTLLVTPDANTNADGALPAAQTTIGDGPTVNIASPGVTSGPIDASAATTTGNELVVGSGTAPEATLAVNGSVELGPLSIFGFSVDGNDTTAGADASEMTVNGNVSLNGAQLVMNQGYLDQTSQACVALTPGNTYTLLTTSGGAISGAMHYWNGNSFSGVVDEGQTSATPTPLVQGCTGGGNAPQAYINYGSTAITETIAGAPTSTAAPAITGAAQVGQTLQASSPGGWSAYPAPGYAYEWLACSAGNCSPIIGAAGSAFTPTSAQLGDTIELQVTATNALGHATADSNSLGPVTAAPAATKPKSGRPTPAQVEAALNGIGHPSGKKAISALIKTGAYRTSFRSPGSGSLSVKWQTTVTSKKGSHVKHAAVNVANATASAHGAGKLTLTIRLTKAGKALLRSKSSSIRITSTQSFRPSGTATGTTVTKKFTL
ncbi:MAG: hypothetical protein FWD04_08795, partial [Conexibacteraceae bacterium]|nr:hypothetical protein [Conexibacteraceae bacterium]